MKSILVVLLLALVFAVSGQENLVNTQYGPVDGVVYDDSRAFLGIPYAAPPTGSLRLALPEPPASWSQPLWAKAYQAGCPQTCQLPPLVCPVNVSEDCLTLNIWTPRLDQITGPLPVMVFVPGGRFEQGASGTVLYNSEYLVNTSKVISVSINYRLGALGFLVAETSSGYQANLGILDQRMALQFVQDNIAQFGGDPTRVTLFGQSAGATSTGIHLTSPASWGYFSQAIMESFPLGLTLPDFDLSKKLSQRFSEDLGCGSDLSNLISCIQTKSIEDILAAQDKSENVVSPVNPLFIFMPWQPTVDGTVVENSVLTAVYNGIYKKVPTIWGTVEQEGLMFVVQVWPDGLPAAEYEVIIDDIFGSNAKGVLQNYPPSFGPGNATLSQMSHLATQYLFICPNLNMSHTMFNAFGANSDFFLYRYDHVMSFYEAWGPNYTFCYDAVCHGAELPFVFHSADKIVPPFNYTAEELVLTAQMSNYWGNFANTGNPNNGPNPVGVQWPQYTESSGYQNIVLETPQITTESLEYNSICEFWNTVGYEIQ